MKNPKKYIINNPHVVAKYSLVIIFGLLLALVCTGLDKLGTHIWLAGILTSGIADGGKSMIILANIGHKLYEVLAFVGVAIMLIGTTPFVLDVVATYKLGKMSDTDTEQ